MENFVDFWIQNIDEQWEVLSDVTVSNSVEASFFFFSTKCFRLPIFFWKTDLAKFQFEVTSLEDRRKMKEYWLHSQVHSIEKEYNIFVYVNDIIEFIGQLIEQLQKSLHFYWIILRLNVLR